MMTQSTNEIFARTPKQYKSIVHTFSEKYRKKERNKMLVPYDIEKKRYLLNIEQCQILLLLFSFHFIFFVCSFADKFTVNPVLILLWFSTIFVLLCIVYTLNIHQ